MKNYTISINIFKNNSCMYVCNYIHNLGFANSKLVYECTNTRVLFDTWNSRISILFIIHSFLLLTIAYNNIHLLNVNKPHIHFWITNTINYE